MDLGSEKFSDTHPNRSELIAKKVVLFRTSVIASGTNAGRVTNYISAYRGIVEDTNSKRVTPSSPESATLKRAQGIYIARAPNHAGADTVRVFVVNDGSIESGVAPAIAAHIAE